MPIVETVPNGFLMVYGNVTVKDSKETSRTKITLAHFVDLVHCPTNQRVMVLVKMLD